MPNGNPVFLNTPLTRQQCIDEAIAHRIAGEFVQHQPYADGRQSWINGKGSALCCQFHPHIICDEAYYAASSRCTGFPLAVSHLQERIFELLPSELATTWNERVYQAVAEGADLSLVASRVMRFLLTRRPDLITDDLYARRLAGDEPTTEQWQSAADAAWAQAETLGPIAEAAGAAAEVGAGNAPAVNTVIAATAEALGYPAGFYERLAEYFLTCLAAAQPKEQADAEGQ